jgi:hypothetical protein
LLVSFAIAGLGIFPFGLLYAFPILASITFRSANRWLRIVVCLASIVLAAAAFLHSVARLNL